MKHFDVCETSIPASKVYIFNHKFVNKSVKATCHVTLMSLNNKDEGRLAPHERNPLEKDINHSFFFVSFSPAPSVSPHTCAIWIVFFVFILLYDN